LAKPAHIASRENALREIGHGAVAALWVATLCISDSSVGFGRHAVIVIRTLAINDRRISREAGAQNH
jgi:hypothetical protein